MEKLSNFSERLVFLMHEKGVTPYVISKETGISEASLSKAINGKTKKMNESSIELLSSYFLVSKDWLRSGNGDKERIETIQSSGTNGSVIPLIPHEAFAGYGTHQYPDLPIEEFYQIREFHNANFLLRVSGDSMSPKYHSGDLVACQKINELTFWQWHRVYAINTRNQGILIKRIEKSDVPDSVTCVSENPAYDPFDINKQEIVSVALVLGGVVME